MKAKYTETFGEFVCQARIKRGKTLRCTAKELGISQSFLSDVEKSNRNPFGTELLYKLADVLNLTEEEENRMMDLVGKERNGAAPDLADYINAYPSINTVLRTAKKLNLGERDWLWILEQIKK